MDSYGISPAIGNGLAFDTTTGAISGSPTAVAEAVTYTITATNGIGTDTAMLTIMVDIPALTQIKQQDDITLQVGETIEIRFDALFSPGHRYSIANSGFDHAVAITNNLRQDGSIASSSSTGLPNSDNVAFRITAFSVGTRDIRVSAADGIAFLTQDFTVTVIANPNPLISVSSSTVTVMVITPVTISSTGATVDSYSISLAIGNGLAFSTTTGNHLWQPHSGGRSSDLHHHCHQ